MTRAARLPLHHGLADPSPRASAFYAGSIAAAAAFAALAALVSTGALDGIDGYAARNLMPYELSPYEIPVFGQLFSYHGHGFDPLQLIRGPASVIPATVLVLVACIRLGRRGFWAAGLLWIGAYVLGNVVAEACKKVLTRPPLEVIQDGKLVPWPGFETSFPSGHAMRAALVAAALATAWPRLRVLLTVWVIAVAIVLDLYGVHAPSDILGGLLLAAAIILAIVPVTRRLMARGTRFREPALGHRAPPTPP